MNVSQRIGFSVFIAAIYLFLYVPIFILLIFSFNTAQFPAPWKTFTFHWYHELSSSTALWKAFYNSIIISLVATFISLALTLAMIYYQSLSYRFNKFFILLYGNVVVPELVLAVGLLSLFSLLSVPLGLPTLIVAHTVLGLGYTIPIIYTRYRAIDNRLAEASLDLGATYGQTFFKVILPLLIPSISAAALLVFILSFDDFILSFFCAGSEAQTLSLYIFSMIRSGAKPIVNALAMILLAFSSLLVAIFCWLNNKTKIF